MGSKQGLLFLLFDKFFYANPAMNYRIEKNVWCAKARVEITICHKSSGLV